MYPERSLIQIFSFPKLELKILKVQSSEAEPTNKPSLVKPVKLKENAILDVYEFRGRKYTKGNFYVPTLFTDFVCALSVVIGLPPTESQRIKLLSRVPNDQSNKNKSEIHIFRF